jgi:hypothetical protein
MSCVAYLTFDRLRINGFSINHAGGANLESCSLGEMRMSLFGGRFIKFENTEPTWLDIASSGYVMIAAGIVTFLLIASYLLLCF